MNREFIEQFVPDSGERFEVIVAGGGPAGLGAALASAHLGAKTLLLEARAFFGGVATVSHWMAFNRILQNGGSRGGAHDMLVDSLKRFGPDASREGKKIWVHDDNLDIHPDYLRIAAFEALEKEKCRYLLHSPVAGAIMDGHTIRGVEVAAKEGKIQFYADAVVDTTGDADVAYFAGAETRKGREGDGAFMSVTLGFVLSHVDEESFFAFEADRENMRAVVKEAEEEGYYTSTFYSFHRTTIPGCLSVNNGEPKNIGRIDATKSHDLTVTERGGIQVAVDFVRFARKKIPGCENCHLMRVGADLGVRETRRVVGEYILTIEDACTGAEFDDVIARKYGGVDPAGLAEDKNYRTSMVSGYAVPYRSLVPKVVDNMLVAGRCASATHLGLAAGKSMGNMMALGQAAGVAAALSSRHSVAPRHLDVREIQTALASMGVDLSK